MHIHEGQGSLRQRSGPKKPVDLKGVVIVGSPDDSRDS